MPFLSFRQTPFFDDILFFRLSVVLNLTNALPGTDRSRMMLTRIYLLIYCHLPCTSAKLAYICDILYPVTDHFDVVEYMIFFFTRVFVTFMFFVIYMIHKTIQSLHSICV